jgi:SAM-dependent methyltransferase
LIAELAALAPDRDFAWDAGTGNGQAARLLTDHFGRVYATDASEEQIARAEPHPQIEFRTEPAEYCSLPDASCDLVLVAQALHWFDLETFYRQVERVLRPGGVLAAIGYGWFYVDPKVDEIVARALLKPIESFWAKANWLLIDGYRTIPFIGQELRLAPSAVHLAWSREQLEDYIRSWSAVRRWEPQRLEAALGELASVWPDNEPRHVFMPMVTRAARL